MLDLAIACVAAVTAIATPPADSTDSLRRVAIGGAIPEFTLPTLDGGELGLADLEGKAVVLVFLSALQRRSELAASGAHEVGRTLHRHDLKVVFATADVDQAGAFRRMLATADLTEPVLLDGKRQLYGDLGLVVLPTTIVIDPKGRLAHVISSYRADYEHTLAAYAEHALGLLDDEQLADRLATTGIEADPTEQRISRHRAAASMLRKRGTPAQAERELRSALALEPAHAGAQLDLAALLIELERIDEAASLVEAVLEADPGYRRARLMQGVVFYHRGRLDEAESVLNEMLVLNADPIQTHYYLGRVFEARGDARRAMDHYKRSLARLLEDHPL